MINRIILIIILVVSCQAVFSQEKTAVDYKAEQTKLVKLGDTTVVKLIGDVYFFHNGAIISCDSAYRYSEKRIEAMGNVIINQNSLYIYGEKVIYNGETEEAQIFSDLIKLVDSSAVMYTRKMLFNTKKKEGYFFGGATMRDSGSLLEAESGTYNTSTKIITLDKRVAMENEEYILKTNALIYDQNREKAFFNTLTNIWNIKGEYLQADKGHYDKLETIYYFEKNSYILTKEQECWSDSLTYFSDENEVELKYNIQLNDTVQRASTFGDYGYFWNKSKNVLMTKNPSMFNYDNAGRDSTFIRADTITVRPIIERTNVHQMSDNISKNMGVLDSLKSLDSTITIAQPKLNDTLRSKQPRNKELINKGTFNISDESEEGEKSDTAKVVKENIGEEPEVNLKDSASVKIPKYAELYDKEALEKMNEKERKRAYREMKRDRSLFDRELRKFLRDKEAIETITKEKSIADSIEEAKKPKPTPPDDGIGEIKEVKNEADSSDMIVRAFGKAKIFKSDMQSVADTLIVESVDSTTTSLGSPIAWNGENQILAGRIRSYVFNGDVNRTRLFDNPIMASQVEEGKFNQMKGNTMDALYRNQEIYKLIVTGNAISRFFKTEVDKETEKEDIVAFITTTSTNMIIDMDSSAVTRIKCVGKTNTVTYPIDMTPDSETLVEGFKWVPELRPIKSEVFDRVIRISVRKEKEALEKPKFEITKFLMEERSNLLKRGVWRDRNDKLKIDRQVLIDQSLEKR